MDGKWTIQTCCTMGATLICVFLQGMEDLIRQAFLHVEVIGPHVAEGHYDLVGPNGEIILPQVWETMIEPDWVITMHMWPMPEPPKVEDPPSAPEPTPVEVPPPPPPVPEAPDPVVIVPDGMLSFLLLSHPLSC